MKHFLDLGTHKFEGLSEFCDQLSIDHSWCVYCYEANPLVYEKAVKSIRQFKNKFQRFSFVNCAVLDTNGTITFHCHKGVWTDSSKKEFKEIVTTGSNALEINPQHDIASGHVFNIVDKQVKCVDIDGIIADIYRNDKEAEIYIKCDIEGSEFVVMPRLLESQYIKNVKQLYIEWHERFWYMNGMEEKIQAKENYLKKFSDLGIDCFALSAHPAWATSETRGERRRRLLAQHGRLFVDRITSWRPLKFRMEKVAENSSSSAGHPAVEAKKVSSDWQRDEFMGLNVAKYRAAHQLLDNPKLLEDPLGVRIIGTEAESELRRNLGLFQEPGARAFRAEVMVRNRYAEDELARSVQAGVRQYVILGAGLDTFAYRNPFPLVQVFEVDHPATQAWKRRCLEKATIPIPSSVTYISADLEQQTLTDALRQSGFESDKPAFVCFIGVIRYLSGEVLKSVLTSIISSMRVGSEIVFDVGPPPSLLRLLRGQALPGRTEVILDSHSAPSVLGQLRERAYGAFSKRAFGNGFQPTYFDLDVLTRDLNRIGFADVELFGPKEMNARYCKNRTDGLRIENPMYLVKARVNRQSAH